MVDYHDVDASGSQQGLIQEIGGNSELLVRQTGLAIGLDLTLSNPSVQTNQEIEYEAACHTQGSQESEEGRHLYSLDAQQSLRFT